MFRQYTTTPPARMRPPSSPPVSPTIQPTSMIEPDASESFPLKYPPVRTPPVKTPLANARQEDPMSHLALILRQAPDRIPTLSKQELLDCIFRTLLAEYARQDRIQAQHSKYPSEREICQAMMTKQAARDEELSRRLAGRDGSAAVGSSEGDVDMNALLQELEIRDKRYSLPATRRNGFAWDKPATEEDFYALLGEWEADERLRTWHCLVGSVSSATTRSCVEFVAPRPGSHVRLPVYRGFRTRRSRRCWQWLKGGCGSGERLSRVTAQQPGFVEVV